MLQKMESLTCKINLINGRTGLKVDAYIKKLSEKNLIDIDTFWNPRLALSEEADRNWNWHLKNRIYSNKSERWAIECEEITQAVAIFDISGRSSQFIPSKKVLYIYVMSVAPWNRPSAQEVRQYKSVGSTFLKFAYKRSEDLGYEGGVGLHSLPESRTFYQSNNMLEVEGSEDEFESEINRLSYFEWVPKPTSN